MLELIKIKGKVIQEIKPTRLIEIFQMIEIHLIMYLAMHLTMCQTMYLTMYLTICLTILLIYQDKTTMLMIKRQTHQLHPGVYRLKTITVFKIKSQFLSNKKGDMTAPIQKLAI